MESKDFHFADRTGTNEPKIELIPPIVIPKEAIDAEIELGAWPRGPLFELIAELATGLA